TRRLRRGVNGGNRPPDTGTVRDRVVGRDGRVVELRLYDAGSLGDGDRTHPRAGSGGAMPRNGRPLLPPLKKRRSDLSGLRRVEDLVGRADTTADRVGRLVHLVLPKHLEHVAVALVALPDRRTSRMR